MEALLDSGEKQNGKIGVEGLKVLRRKRYPTVQREPLQNGHQNGGVASLSYLSLISASFPVYRGKSQGLRGWGEAKVGSAFLSYYKGQRGACQEKVADRIAPASERDPLRRDSLLPLNLGLGHGPVFPHLEKSIRELSQDRGSTLGWNTCKTHLDVSVTVAEGGTFLSGFCFVLDFPARSLK